MKLPDSGIRNWESTYFRFMDQGDQIFEAVNAIILSSERKLQFEDSLDRFVIHRELFLQELLRRTEDDSLARFCERHSAKIDDQALDRASLFEVRERAAKLLGVSIPKQQVGLTWKGSEEQLRYLYDELMIENLIKDGTPYELFYQVFTGQRSESGAPICWMHDKRSLAYLLLCLSERHDILGPKRFNSLLSKHRLFNYSGSTPVGDVLNELSGIRNGEFDVTAIPACVKVDDILPYRVVRPK